MAPTTDAKAAMDEITIHSRQLVIDIESLKLVSWLDQFKIRSAQLHLNECHKLLQEALSHEKPKVY